MCSYPGSGASGVRERGIAYVCMQVVCVSMCVCEDGVCVCVRMVYVCVSVCGCTVRI